MRQKLCRERSGIRKRHDLVILAVHDERRHVDGFQVGISEKALMQPCCALAPPIIPDRHQFCRTPSESWHPAVVTVMVT